MTTPTTSTATTATPRGATGNRLLNKVPEVTIWFWIIKILCTTVGESFADYINTTLGFGLTNTMLLFTAIFAVVLAIQFRTKRYSPFPYWLTVVVVSVTGTLYTDMLTDQQHVPLWLSSTVFSILLALVFGVWWMREGTLSIHSITTFPREAFYWLTVLVTFALGTATGDWTLQLTNWTPAQSVFLPLGLIASITLLWRFGANPVLAFWLAYILTRPLGANIGDWLASPKTATSAGEPVGLGLGTLATSLIFLSAILATVVYLSISRSDVAETHEITHEPSVTTSARKERIALGALALIAAATVTLMAWAHNQPHVTCDPTGQSETLPACQKAALTSGQTTAAVTKYEKLAQTAIAQDKTGTAAASHATVQRMRDDWDADATSLQAVDQKTWTLLDDQMDAVLKAYAIDHGKIQPAPAAEQEKQLAVLLGDLHSHRFATAGPPTG
ncbi:COG4705 family protein [Streptomyces sp. CA-111067]|uniref:COG4705 family protein n=1 Tax=Streptomyces sp. CA-111067 TaxID=3240046 RepID=UPI003D97B6C6